MAQTIFYPDLNKYCQDNFVVRPGIAAPDPQTSMMETYKQHVALFEHLLLFDTVCFKVTGECVPLPVLIKMFGQRGFDALVEQGAFKFTLWNEHVLFLQQNIPGINAIMSGVTTTPEHSDPERSIESGLRWMQDAPTGRRRRQLVRRVLPLFSTTKKGVAAKAVEVVQQALKGGGLEVYGIPKITGTADKLTDVEKHIIASCAEDFAEYDYLLDHGMTSFSAYKYFSPFWATAKRFKTMSRTVEGYAAISQVENMPDLKALFADIKNPMQRLPELRASGNAKRFRSWLETTAGDSPDKNMVAAYLDTISDRKGVLDSASGKLLKTVVFASVGLAAGAAVAGPAGAAVGVAAAPLAEKAAEFGVEATLGLFDNFVLERATKGWSPRMFFDDLSRLRSEKNR